MLSLFLDVLVLMGMGITIFFALRLSNALKNVREGREEFEALINQLNKSIARAHDTLLELKEVAQGSSGIQVQIEEARRLAEELKVTNKAQRSARAKDAESENYNEQLYNSLAAVEERSKADQDSAPAFFIRDYDLEDDGGEEEEFQSQAEKELLQALKSNKKSA